MSTYDGFSQKKLLLPPPKRLKDRFLIIHHDWFIPVQSLRRINTENELESLVFPQDQSFDSHWQLFFEHQTHPERFRIGLLFLSPFDRCLHADVKLVLIINPGEQILKEYLFENHLFFLTKGEAMTSLINERISPKVYFDLENELYESLSNTDECTIIAYVKFLSEVEIDSNTKAYDFSRELTINWKITKFQQNSPAKKQRHHRLLSNRFQFTHTKIIEGLRTKNYKLTLHYSRSTSLTKQTPFVVTLQCANPSQFNYGKFEIICRNDHNILRRYIESMEDLTDHYSIEFFSLDELSMNIYKYKQNFNEINGRFILIDYLLISIRIIQPLNPSDVFRKMKHKVEPIVISLNTPAKIEKKKEKRTKSMLSREKQIKSPISQQNLRTTSLANPVFPPIRIQNPSSPTTRLRSSTSLRTLPNLNETNHLSRSFMYKPMRITKPNAITTPSMDLTDNFTFLNNLFRSGLHSDILIRCQDRQWNLHKSILSTRSIYFNQYFANSNQSSELILTDENPLILEKVFLFLYTNQYLSLDKQTRFLFQLALKYGIDTLTLLCLQDMCNTSNLTNQTAANLLIALHQAITDPYEKYHSIDYLNQIKLFKQIILRFIQNHSRDVLLSNSWKILEKHYPNLVHDVLEFVIFEKIDE